MICPNCKKEAGCLGCNDGYCPWCKFDIDEYLRKQTKEKNK